MKQRVSVAVVDAPGLDAESQPDSPIHEGGKEKMRVCNDTKEESNKGGRWAKNNNMTSVLVCRDGLSNT
jgi:hypothetical protein